jgi:hypothetical protein
MSEVRQVMIGGMTFHILHNTAFDEPDEILRVDNDGRHMSTGSPYATIFEYYGLSEIALEMCSLVARAKIYRIINQF